MLKPNAVATCSLLVLTYVLLEQILGSVCISGFNKLLCFNANRINLNSYSQQAVLSQNIVFKPRQDPVYIDKRIRSP